MALTKVSGGILDPGINVAGIVTATGFDGPFTGGSSKNITAGVVTATNLDLNGNGDISGNLVVGGNLTANGDFTTLNTTLREVELLRVDTNNDNVAAGIITQTGAGDILRLYDGTSQVVAVDDTGRVGIGSLIPTQKLDIVGNTKISGNIDANGSLNIAGVSTFSDDVKLTVANGNGILLDKSTSQFNVNSGTIVRFQNNNEINADDGKIGTALFGSGLNIVGSQTGSGLGRQVRLFGDLLTNHIKPTADSTHNIGISTNRFANAYFNNLDVDGNTELDKVNVTGLSTFSNNVTFKGTTSGRDLNWDYGSNKLNLADNVLLGLGGSDDLLIHHTGTTGYIKGQTGNLYIQSDQVVVIGNQTDSTAGLKFISGGAAELFHNNSLRLATTAQGINVTTVGDVPQVSIAQTTTGAYSVNGTVSFVNANNTTAQIQGRTGAASTTGDIIFLCNTVGDETLAVLEDGKVRVPDRGKFVAGSGNDLRLYHNSVDSTTHIENFTGDLNIQSNVIRLKRTDAGQTFASFINNGQAEFSFSGNTKLSTSLTGITVTGEVAASQDYPDLRPTLDLNFVAEKKLDPRITYQRTGPASFTNEFGKVVLIGDNSPRFDHNPTTRDCKGLLCEESRKNYLENGDFVSSYGSGNSWAYGVGTDVFSASSGSQLSTNPDGSSPAYHYAPSSTAGYHRFNRTFTVDAYDTSYVVSVFAKRVTEGSVSSLNRYLEIEISGNFALNGAPTGHSGSHGMSGITYDLQDGVVENASTNNFGYVGGAKMEKFADGWWRLSYVFNPGTNDGSSSLTGNIWFGHPTSVGSDDGSETGNGNPSFYLWGAMIEKGGFLTSYIPNHGAYQATRGVDITTIDGDEFTEFYNDDEWTMVTHTNVDNSQSLVASPSEVNSINFEGDNNTKKFVTRYVTSSTDNQGYVDVIGSMSGTNYFDLVGATVGAYNVKTAFAAKVNDVAASFNGGTVQTDTSVTMLEGGSIMNIGQNPKQFHIKRIMYYPKRLPNNQLRTLTS